MGIERKLQRKRERDRERQGREQERGSNAKDRPVGTNWNRLEEKDWSQRKHDIRLVKFASITVEEKYKYKRKLKAFFFKDVQMQRKKNV